MFNNFLQEGKTQKMENHEKTTLEKLTEIFTIKKPRLYMVYTVAGAAFIDAKHLSDFTGSNQ